MMEDSRKKKRRGTPKVKARRPDRRHNQNHNKHVERMIIFCVCDMTSLEGDKRERRAKAVRTKSGTGEVGNRV